MHKLLFAALGLAFVMLSASMTMPAPTGDRILGVWLTGSKEAKVEIFKKGDQYFGKIIWLIPEKQAKKDEKNPDAALRSQPLVGLEMLKGFSFDKGDDEWSDGTIYDPKNGKTYSCILTLKDARTLNVRGYIGFSMIGRTDVWTKEK